MPEIPLISKKKPLLSLSLIFFYLIVFVVVIFVIHYLSTIKSDLVLFESLRPAWLLVALVAQFGTYYFNALVYQILLEIYTRKNILSLKELLKISIIMLFLNQIVPSAGISGNAFLSQILVKKGVAVEKSLSLTLLFLLTSFIAMAVLIVLVIIIGIFFNFPRFFFIILALGVLAFGILSTFTAIAGRKRTINYLLGKVSRIGFIKKSIQRYKAIAEPAELTAEDPVRILLSKKKIALKSIASKMGIVACDIFTIYALFLGFGVFINPLAVAVGYILTQILTLLPVSPGALVIYEGGMIFFFTQMGIPLGAAVTVVLLYRILSFWLPIPVGLFIYRNLQKKT